jgi:hypothetical protein
VPQFLARFHHEVELAVESLEVAQRRQRNLDRVRELLRREGGDLLIGEPELYLQVLRLVPLHGIKLLDRDRQFLCLAVYHAGFGHGVEAPRPLATGARIVFGEKGESGAVE